MSLLRCIDRLPKRALGAAVLALALYGCRFDLDPALDVGAHQLGGTVGGLDADGLVLANGDDRLAVPRGATRFTMPQHVLAGATYSIRIEQQPAGLTCSVAAGSGRMLAHDVPNAVVTCSRNAYAIAGRVEGLATAGLVLANGADTLAVAPGDTTFRMPAPVASGGAYGVTVATQPTGQACRVDGGQGQVTVADVSSVVVTCTNDLFSVGGSITGLISSGLVLQVDGEALAVAAGEATFTGPVVLIHGSAYAVTIGQQPVGQTCSVSRGAGTLVAANVEDVQVTCANNAYRLGGTIAGLASAGLVLANGSDTLAVPSLGSMFTMPAPVAFTGPYAVTVQTQPAGMTCSVARAAGAMGSADVTDVTVVCAPNAYALGGQLGGLVTSGLVIANGTDTLAVAPYSASFAMPQAVAFGAAYDVQVQVQPIGHGCSVSRGSGTMPAGAVSDVDVQCSANRYALGGSITGLGAAGLVLSNGSDSLSVPAGSTAFTMPQPVPYGSSYAVAVGSQPRWQDCAVSPASGTMGAAAVADVAVACQASLYVSTVAGSGTAGFADGAAASAQFHRPTSVAVDAAGVVYVADMDNHRIRRIAVDGSVSTLAGTGQIGTADGPGASAQFNAPRGVAVDRAGNVYVADSDNSTIRKILPDGTVSTLATGLFYPYGLAVDAAGNVIVADTGSHRIRKVAPDGTVTTIAGSTGGWADGIGAAAQFAVPYHVALDDAGNIFVADSNNARIRKIAPGGVVTTLAGTGVTGQADGPGATAQFFLPLGVAADNDGNVYVIDAWNQRVRRISAAGVVSTLTGSTAGFLDGAGATARFAYPFGIALAAPGGALVIADTYNHRIRRISRTP
jgi:sugar lactone lactonase YvrE